MKLEDCYSKYIFFLEGCYDGLWSQVNGKLSDSQETEDQEGCGYGRWLHGLPGFW